MKPKLTFVTVVSVAFFALVSGLGGAKAHGYAGARFFPATLSIDDPFVSDELSLPTVETSRDSDLVRETDISLDFSKRITKDFGIGVGESWVRLSAPGEASVSGFANLAISAKYLAITDAPHEFLLSFGVDAEIGGTGAGRIGADRFSTISPAAFIGKGLGDLPEDFDLLRPIAITAALGVDIPTRKSTPDGLGGVELHPDLLTTGIAIEYNLQYLQTQVRDIGLGAPFNRLIPLVEISLASPINRDGGGTTGTSDGRRRKPAS